MGTNDYKPKLASNVSYLASINLSFNQLKTLMIHSQIEEWVHDRLLYLSYHQFLITSNFKTYTLGNWQDLKPCCLWNYSSINIISGSQQTHYEQQNISFKSEKYSNTYSIPNIFLFQARVFFHFAYFCTNLTL